MSGTVNARAEQQTSEERKRTIVADSPQNRKLIRQNTDLSESDASESFATPPSSPLKETALSPAQKSPLTWNSNPIYRTGKSGSTSSSPTRSPTRSQSFRSTVSSLGTEPSPMGSSTNRRSLRSTSKSSSVESPSGTSGHFTFTKSSTSFGSGSSPPSKRVKAIDNKSSVFSQQTLKSVPGPPPPPTRKDSITKARKNSRKLDTENMLYGAKDVVQENGEEIVKQTESLNEESKSEDAVLDSVQKRKESPARRSRTSSTSSSKNDSCTAVNGKMDTVDKADSSKSDRIKFSVDTERKSSNSNYLDGFLMDAPDNTLIKPSKLRESMRKNRARRAQTAPVERGDVDKALEEIDRRWAKPERNTALSHLPLADRLAFRKMRTEREQNNNEINRLLKKEMPSNVGVNKVLTASPSSNVATEDSMNSPVNVSSCSSTFDSPAITPILQLSNTSTPTGTEGSVSRNAPCSSPVHTIKEPLSPKVPPPDTQIFPDQKESRSMKGSGANENLLDTKQWTKGRSSSLDDHVSTPLTTF